MSHVLKSWVLVIVPALLIMTDTPRPTVVSIHSNAFNTSDSSVKSHRTGQISATDDRKSSASSCARQFQNSSLSVFHISCQWEFARFSSKTLGPTVRPRPIPERIWRVRSLHPRALFTGLSFLFVRPLLKV